MCGITGYIDTSSNVPFPDAIKAMTNTITHRGPNDSGYWENSSLGIAFGHRRLSILDVSPDGHQPMLSQSRRYVIIFNGEIYNYQLIRLELEKNGHHFKGRSDTEVMLAAIEEWGLNEAIQKFNGMFAFALWDSKTELLHLARDRIGEKPLYYGWSGGAFLFGSELKALKAHPKFQAAISKGALALTLRHSYVPTPWSIYRKIFKLIPGSILSIKVNQCRDCPSDFSPFPDKSGNGLSPITFWSVENALNKGRLDPFVGDEELASHELEKLLYDSVGIRMVADVPLGAFLSGGIDSSAIVALMQAQSTRPVRTFSIGFRENEYDESVYARQVANHLGTEHTELYVDPQDALNVIPFLPTMFDEPFSDSSQIPTYLVSKLCSDKVTVSLSGDGGDELFGGYERYSWANKMWPVIGKVPLNVRQHSSRAIEFLSGFQNLGNSEVKSYRTKVGQKMQTLASVLKAESKQQLYQNLMSHWSGVDELVIDYERLPTTFDKYSDSTASHDYLSDMMSTDMISYLPDDILVKVDRASMAASLETRAPFLDHRLIEFSLALPSHLKINGGITKRVLRRLLYRHIPKTLIDRPKMGFAIPIDRWLRGELREWAENLISERKLKDQGLFHSEPIRKKWKEHMSGARDWQHYLWDVIMVQAWLEA